MRIEQVVQFLTALHAKNIRVSGGWVSSSCVLARWTHAKGSDSTPSFAVSVDPSAPSGFNCFSCVQGDLHTLLALIEAHAAANDVSLATLGTREARIVLAGEELVVMPLPAFTEFGDGEQQFIEWPDWRLDAYPKVNLSSEGMAYLKYGRAADGNQPVSDSIIEDFDLRVDPERQMVVAPYRTVGGLLAGMRGRCYNAARDLKHYDYPQKNETSNAGLVWFNERALETTAPVIVVEGQFDAMNVAQVYPHVVACLSSKVPIRKLQKLLQAEFTLWMLDNDKTGQDHQQGYVSRDLPDGYMGWLQRQGALTGKLEYEEKDPAKIDPEWLREQLKGTLPL